MIRCLLVDDDAEICTLVANYLQGFGMEVVTARDAASMQHCLNSQLTPGGGFSVVLLDVMLPDASGLDLCRWLRQTQPRLPVIMLTAQGDPISRVVGLEMGADDYVPKPFEPRELVARINAVLRRARAASEQVPSAVVRFAAWTFDRVTRQLTSPQGVLVALSNAEFRLLTAFVDHAGRVLSRDQLIDLTRGPGAEITDRSIDLAVSRLRQKLADSPSGPQLIRTVRGAGYQFNTEVSR